MSELIRKLKADEENHSFSKYLERERKEVNVNPQDFVELDPAQIINPNDTEKLMLAESIVNGYCVNPEGGVYAQQTIELENVTCEMLNWWFAFYPLESYRYLMWMPESHHSVAIADCDREKILNEFVPMNYKTRGVLHAMLRNEGRGLEEVNTRFFNPTKVGFDLGKIKSRNVGTLITGWTVRQALDNLAHPNRFPARNYYIDTIVGRDIEGGVRVNLYTWIGWRYDYSGKAGCALPPFVKLPKEVAYGTLLYAPKEWKALQEFVPELFNETNGQVF